jgi:hypothetical protein
VELSWLAPHQLGRTTVVGSQRTVVCDDGAREPVRVFDVGVEPVGGGDPGEFRLQSRLGDVVAPQIDASEPLAALMTDFINAVIHGSVPRSHIGLGLEVVRLIEEVERYLARPPGG